MAVLNEETCAVGNYIEFGNYHGNKLNWKVLAKDGNRRLLFLDKPVDYMCFYPERVNSEWAMCTLRRWLNKDFLEQSFTLQERMSILLSMHRNNVDPRWYLENGPDTKDKAFVFNIFELDEFVPDIKDRAVGEWWWLRGHGCSNLNQHAVYYDGTVYMEGVSCDAHEVGVRPAMWIKINPIRKTTVL